MENKKEFAVNWLFISSLIFLSMIALSIFSYFGIFGRTVVERKVFENSYQYQAARRTEERVSNAQLMEIQIRLQDPNLDESTRHNLEAQAAAIRVYLGGLN